MSLYTTYVYLPEFVQNWLFGITDYFPSLSEYFPAELMKKFESFKLSRSKLFGST